MRRIRKYNEGRHTRSEDDASMKSGAKKMVDNIEKRRKDGKYSKGERADLEKKFVNNMKNMSSGKMKKESYECQCGRVHAVEYTSMDTDPSTYGDILDMNTREIEKAVSDMKSGRLDLEYNGEDFRSAMLSLGKLVAKEVRRDLDVEGSVELYYDSREDEFVAVMPTEYGDEAHLATIVDGYVTLLSDRDSALDLSTMFKDVKINESKLAYLVTVDFNRNVIL